MITQVKKQNLYEELFQKSFSQSTQPAWLKDLRLKAFEYFSQNGFPTPEDEEWKYTNTAPITREQFSLSVEKKPSTQLENLIYKETQRSYLVFFNGQFIRELSNLEAASNIEIFSFSEALKTNNEILEEKLAKQVQYQRNGFTALNTAFIENGLFLHIPENQKVSVPIQILFVSTENVIATPRILILVAKGAEATLIESYLRSEQARYFTNAVIEISLEDRATLKHHRIQRESHNAFHITTTDVEIGEESIYDSTNITLGAKWSRHEISAKFTKEKAEVFVDGLYLTSGEQFADTHSVIDHLHPNCKSRQNYKGIVDGKSRVVFNGKIFVREGAKGTDAHQSNKNLLLSSNARIDTKPQLEIFNDDVQCSHGATVGQLEEEEIFYLMSRGLPASLAKNLLTYGFAEEIINKIELESVKATLDEALLNRLSVRL